MAGKKIPYLGNQIPDTKPDQERYLPIANVSRIMKKSLPTNAKISKDAKETVQECVSEFINFITGEASDKCQREKRKTINGDDILWAMTTLGFENYVGPLKVYLNMHRDNTASSSPMEDAGENVEIFTGSNDHQSQNFNSGNNYFLSLGSQFDPQNRL